MVANLYVDFGDLLPDAISMPQNAVGSAAGWSTFGLGIPQDDQQWLFGPLFPYAGNPMITYVPLREVVEARPNFSFSVGLSNENNPIEFETGPNLPVATLDALEASIMEQLTRMLAPYNINVIQIDSQSLQDARDQMSFNNRLENPNEDIGDIEDWTPAPDGRIGRNWVQTGGLTNSATGDAYILIGGWLRGDANGVQIGSEAGIYGTSEPNGTNLITPELDPQMPVPDPIFGITPIPYTDGAGAVSADTILDQHIVGNLKANVAIAAVAAQMAAISFGLSHSHDGLPSPLNPFFNPDVDLLTGSNTMREGPGTYPKVSPTNLNVPYFSRFDLMRGNDNVNMLFTQNAHTFFSSSLDYGTRGNVSYVTGTGAYDRITITDAGGGMARVTIRPYRDASMSSSSFISTWDPLAFAFTTEATPFSYLIDPTPGPPPGPNDPLRFVLLEGGRGNDLIEIDPSLAGVNWALFGGEGVDNLTMIGTGAQTATYSPFYRNDIGFDQTKNYDGTILLGNGTVLQFFEFDDTSTVHLQNFASVTATPPVHLPTNLQVDFVGNTIRFNGTAGPTFLPGGGILSPEIGMANLNLVNVANVIIDTSGALFGGSLADDNVVVRSNGVVPVWLSSFTINTGNDGSVLLGTAGDTVHIDDSGSFTPINYTINPTLVKHSTTHGGFAGFFHTGAETLKVTGSTAINNFAVTPSATTEIVVDGNLPSQGATPGDALNVDPIPGRQLIGSAEVGAGRWTFPGLQDVVFTNIESSLFSTAPPNTQEILALGGGDAGQGEPIIQIVDVQSYTVLNTFLAYEASFKGGIRLSTADLGGSDDPEIVVAPGNGRVAEVKIFNQAGTLLNSFLPEGAGYVQGLYVATGDVDGDGDMEIITSVSRGPSRIRIYDVGPGFAVTLLTTLNLPFESAVIGGVVVASGNVRGDGRWEVIAAPASGIAAQVRVFEFDGAQLVKKSQFNVNALPSTFKNGVSIAAGDIDGNGVDEIIIGAGAQGQSRVMVYSATGSGSLNLTPIRNFFAFTSGNTNAALRVATHRVDSLGRDILFVSQGNDGQSGEIRLFDLSLNATLVDTIFATDPGFGGGINVG